MIFAHRNRRPEPPASTKSTALTDLIALHSLGSAQWSGRDSTSLAVNGFRGNVIAYRCIQMISESAASVPLIVCEKRMRLDDHPLIKLLMRPNADQTGNEFRETLYGYLQIHGDAYIEIIGEPRNPLGLFLLRPDRVQVETDKSGWPTGYTYKAGGSVRRISRAPDGNIPILHVRLFNPIDDQYGQSPLQVAGNAVDLHNAAIAWNKSLIDNAARPSGALIYKGPEGASHLTAEQFERLKAELGETYQGARNAGRPMLLDGGLEWKPMSLSPAEMNFQELKNGAARDIALAFGVPPMLLGIPGDNTYSNYQQAVLAFWRQTILPLVGKVAGTLSVGLSSQPCEISFDVDAIEALVDSRTHRLNAILQADFLTDGEKRNALGFSSTPSTNPQ